MRTQTRLDSTPRSARPGMIPASVRTLAERSTPTEIRMDIQRLMQQEQMDLAQALSDAGLALYPNSDEMLAMGALLAISRGDWTEGIDLLTQLQTLQGEAAPATTFWLHGRCQRCMGDLEGARATMEEGLRRHPASAELQSELSLLMQAMA